MMNYAIDVIKNACEDIQKQDITPKPLVVTGDPCETCKFFAICKFDESCGNYKRAPQVKITEQNFVEKEEDE